MLWRQGDLYIEPAAKVPTSAIQRPDFVLADGEMTGHQHRVEDFRSAVVYEDRGQVYVEVFADLARIVHDEHAAITLDRGVYRVWRQREYDPFVSGFSRPVLD